MSTSTDGDVRIEPIGPGDRDFVRAELHQHWHSTTIWSIGKPYQADALPGFIARLDGGPAGLITLHFNNTARHCEIITLSSAVEDRGVGTALMQAAEDQARSRAFIRVFLTTTNDNLRALRFYQRRQYRIVAVHCGMMDRYRGMGQPIPLVGKNGIPLRDEIELELSLASPAS